MTRGLVSPTEEGAPRGEFLSPELSDVCPAKFDKRLKRMLRFLRRAVDRRIYDALVKCPFLKIVKN
jgi:hypothetical protein